MPLFVSPATATFSPKLSCGGGRSIKLSTETRCCLHPGRVSLDFSNDICYGLLIQEPRAIVDSVGFSNSQKKKSGNRVSSNRLAVKNHSGRLASAGFNGKRHRRLKENPFLSEGRDDENYGPICPGCGVCMQDKDPDLLGYFKRKTIKDSEVKSVDGADMVEEIDGLYMEEDDESEGRDMEGVDIGGDEFDWDSDEWEDKLVRGEDEMEGDGFAPAGVGYGNITEEIIENRKRKKLSKTERKQMHREAKKDQEVITVCARCHSLRNYGQVKNQSAENLIPDFDFDKLIATRFKKPSGKADATVVVLVVDCVDFDGSFPKRAAKSLFRVLQGAENDPVLRRKCPKLVLVGTKIDLLPSQISPTRLDRWVRQRAKAGGAPKLNGVYLVSAHKDLGVRNLLAFIKDLAGPRGNVWFFGAQNAGKSTLINAFAEKQGAKVTRLTEAPVPGTTLGILRIGGVLPAKAKMYDTPGLLHPYLMSLRLNRDEQKMVEIRKELKPRTYRVKVLLCCFLPISVVPMPRFSDYLVFLLLARGVVFVLIHNGL